MRRCLYLAVMVALVALVFAPAAMAQEMGDDNNMMEDNHMMGDDNMMSSASSSAMSSASSSAMSSASSSASAMMSPSASASAMMSPSASASALPGTGGTPLLPLLSAAALILLVGSGLVAATVVRRHS